MPTVEVWRSVEGMDGNFSNGLREIVPAIRGSIHSTPSTLSTVSNRDILLRRRKK